MGDRRRPAATRLSWNGACAVLDADPSVVLAYTKTDFVDGMALPWTSRIRGGTSCRTTRRRDWLAIRAGHFVNAALGVIRTDALRQTHLVPRYSGGDFRLMAELSLLGKFVEIPEPLYVRRIHQGSTKGNTGNAVWLRRYYGGAATGQPRRVLAPVRGPRQDRASGGDPDLAEGGSARPARADDGHRSRSALSRARRVA